METQPLGSVPSVTAGMVGPARPVQITNKDEALSFIKSKESISSVKELDPLIKYFNLPGTLPATIGDILSRTPDTKLFAVCTYWRATSQNEIKGFRKDESGAVAYRDKIDAALASVIRPFTTVSGTEMKGVDGLRLAADILYDAIPASIVKSILNKDGAAGIEGLYNTKTPESGDLITALNRYMQDNGPKIGGVFMQNGKATLYTIIDGSGTPAPKKAADILAKLELDESAKKILQELPRDQRVKFLTKVFAAEEEAKINTEEELRIKAEEEFADDPANSIGVEGGLKNLGLLDNPDAPPELVDEIKYYLEQVELSGRPILPIENENPGTIDLLGSVRFYMNDELQMPMETYQALVDWLNSTKPSDEELE